MPLAIRVCWLKGLRCENVVFVTRPNNLLRFSLSIFGSLQTSVEIHKEIFGMYSILEFGTVQTIR